MSRAFAKEDDDREQPVHFGLPPRDDPSYDKAAALVLLEAARDGLTHSAEQATGYRFGEPALHKHVRKLMEKEEERPFAEQDARFITMAKRFLRT